MGEHNTQDRHTTPNRRSFRDHGAQLGVKSVSYSELPYLFPSFFEDFDWFFVHCMYVQYIFSRWHPYRSSLKSHTVCTCPVCTLCYALRSGMSPGVKPSEPVDAAVPNNLPTNPTQPWAPKISAKHPTDLSVLEFAVKIGIAK
jgi:hypothetical protein